MTLVKSTCLCVCMCAGIGYFFVPVGLHWVHLVDWVSLQLDKSPLDGDTRCVCVCVHVRVVMGIEKQVVYYKMM